MNQCGLSRAQAPACESLAQLDPLSIYFFSTTPFFFILERYFQQIILGKKKTKQATQFLNSKLLKFFKLTFSCKKTSVENFPDTCIPICELQNLTFHNLFFWIHQENYDSNCESSVSFTGIVCFLFNNSELPLLGGKDSGANLFRSLYGTSRVAIHTAGAQSTGRSGTLFLGDRLLFQLV